MKIWPRTLAAPVTIAIQESSKETGHTNDSSATLLHISDPHDCVAHGSAYYSEALLLWSLLILLLTPLSITFLFPVFSFVSKASPASWILLELSVCLILIFENLRWDICMGWPVLLRITLHLECSPTKLFLGWQTLGQSHLCLSKLWLGLWSLKFELRVIQV